MKIIFLDVDGVLNSQNYLLNSNNKISNSINPKKITLLKELVDETGSNIVVTSAWRLSKNFQILKNVFQIHDLKIQDKTELIRGKRGEEIKLYLQKHPNIDNFVILDDEIFEDYDDYLLKHLVKTSFYIDGLTEEHIEQAKIILNKKDIKIKKYDN